MALDNLLEVAVIGITSSLNIPAEKIKARDVERCKVKISSVKHLIDGKTNAEIKATLSADGLNALTDANITAVKAKITEAEAWVETHKDLLD